MADYSRFFGGRVGSGNVGDRQYYFLFRYYQWLKTWPKNVGGTSCRLRLFSNPEFHGVTSSAGVLGVRETW